ncbi:MAG: TIGR03747 family integrating conjugative element membrane protein [Proteobacteria bacterium]|nr:TIGR03747 family integrating conjugative element membrane protein [Pseudomonadota bacterium]
MARPPTRNRDAAAHPARKGFIAALFGRIGSAIRWLLLSLLVSIVVEGFGMVFWWPEQGLEHSRQMLAQEIEYLDQDFRQSVLTSDPASFARTLAERSHYFLFELTGVLRLSAWLSRPPADGETGIRSKLHRAYAPITRFVTAAIQIVQVFSVRLAILCLATPVFLLFSLIGLVDGLVQRDLRRWGGGRESSYLYHYAKSSVWMFMLSAWICYLALPFSLHPVFIVLPFAILFATSISITARTFKKYL